LGFNTLGVHNPLSPSLRETGALYYVVELKNPHNWGWNSSRAELVAAFRKRPVDVFAPAFLSALDAEAEELVKPRAGDPLLLGYAYTDGPPWTVGDENESPASRSLDPAERLVHPWVLALMELPAAAEGKREWVAAMKERHASPEEAAAPYGIAVSSWDELAAHTAWDTIADADRAGADSRAFLGRIMRKWYAARRDAIRKHDKNHLILGDKLNMNRDARQPDRLAEALRAMADSVDAINIQYYGHIDGHREALALLYRETGKPVFYGDATFDPIWKDQEPGPAAEEYYAGIGRTFGEELRKLFAIPYVVGWHHCGYMRGLRPTYVTALNKGDRKEIEAHEKGRRMYREGFVSEREEPIAPVTGPLAAALAEAPGIHASYAAQPPAQSPTKQ
jgi:hypothetical protein